MPPKTAKRILKNTLYDLSDANFKEFCDTLVDRRAEPCVRRHSVEDKSRLDIADVMINTFTEKGALKVAEEILRDIGCNQVAALLAEEAGGGSSSSRSSAMEHFVDEHRDALIQRVSSVDPILDALLKKKVIQEEDYDTIRALPTSQKKMRELYAGPLKAGEKCKNIFLEILRVQQPYLIADLE